MSILQKYFLPAMPVILVIGGLVAARLTRHRLVDLSRGLAINFMLSCCFAGPFFRVGWDKAVAAFLILFVITAPITIARWSAHRHYLSTVASKEPKEKVAS